jgi:L-fuconolactonase
MSAVVDGHLHLFQAVSDDYPRTTYEVMAEADRAELAETLLEAMDRAGVDHAVVVPLSRHDDYLRDVLARFPGRFAGIGIYDHDHPDDPAGVEERRRRSGLQGLRFYGLGADQSTTVDTLACGPVLEYMASQGLVVWFYGDPVQLALMDQFMQRHPELVVVMNHCGFLADLHAEMRIDEFRRPRFDVDLPPAGLEMVLDLAARHENLYVHLSGYYAFSHEPFPYRDLTGVAQRLHGAFGAERMLMASDWPWIRDEPGYGEILSVVDELLPGLSADERDAIRGGTALRLLRFG